MQDCVAKGRNLRGPMHPGHKLSETKVRAIRVDGRSSQAIANDYGVSASLIDKVRRRRGWNHVI